MKISFQHILYVKFFIHIGDKVLVRNHVSDVWDAKHDVTYPVGHAIGHQLELMHERGKSCKVNVWHIKLTYHIDEFIKYLPDKKDTGCAAMYWTCPWLIGNLNWSINKNLLSNLMNSINGSTQSDQTNLIQNMSVPDSQKWRHL